MRLYHFPMTADWVAIRESGTLLPTWPRDGSAEKIVNFTDAPDPALLPEALQERSIRITVEIEDANVKWWQEWGPENVPPESWLSLGVRNPHDPNSSLNQWNQGADHWYVTTSPVPRESWLEVVDLMRGAHLDY